MSARTADPSRRGGAPSVRGGERQRRLITDLARGVADSVLTVPEVIDLVHTALRPLAGLSSSWVLREVADAAGAAVPLCGVGPPPDVPAKLPAGVPLTDATSVVLPLRRSGQLLGWLLMTGRRLDSLTPDTLDVIAMAVTEVLHHDAEQADHERAARYLAAQRSLFERGSAVATVEEAARILAAVTEDVFETERSALLLIDGDGRICFTTGVGLSAELEAALATSLVGRVARDSPLWRSTEIESGPILVDDAGAVAVRAGGFVQTLQVRSYIAMPLMSAGELVGMVVCGDVARSRVWSGRDRDLARQLALQGALVVHWARLRQAERAHVERLAYQASHDALTGLANRALLLERLEEAVGTALPAGRRLALLLVDLDGFKLVNDTYGHHAGDLLLKRIAGRARHALRAGDLVARFGGDEFAVLLAGDVDQVQAQRVAARLHEALTAPCTVDGVRVWVGASIGVALLPEHATDARTLLRCADEAMYRAKRLSAGPRFFAVA